MLVDKGSCLRKTEGRRDRESGYATYCCWGGDTTEEIRERKDNYVYEEGRKARKV